GAIAAVLALVVFFGYRMSPRTEPFALKTVISFLVGAVCSGLAGYTGMYCSIRANIRTASAARTSLNKALQMALRGGAVTGLVVVALSLLGVGTLFLVFGGLDHPQAVPYQLVGFGFGASLVALFAQLGGGIYTKAADVGADLVGKVEAGIPEDDPRNPAVIADLVGDDRGGECGRDDSGRGTLSGLRCEGDFVSADCAGDQSDCEYRGRLCGEDDRRRGPDACAEQGILCDVGAGAAGVCGGGV